MYKDFQLCLTFYLFCYTIFYIINDFQEIILAIVRLNSLGLLGSNNIIFKNKTINGERKRLKKINSFFLTAIFVRTD